MSSPPRRRLEPRSATPGRYRVLSSGQCCSQAAELRGVSRLSPLDWRKGGVSALQPLLVRARPWALVPRARRLGPDPGRRALPVLEARSQGVAGPHPPRTCARALPCLSHLPVRAAVLGGPRGSSACRCIAVITGRLPCASLSLLTRTRVTLG